MADEEELKIDLEEQKPEKQEEKQEDPVQNLAKQYEELKAKNDADEAARLAAERRAQEATQYAQRALQEAEHARSQTAETEFGSITHGLSAAEAEAEAGATEFARAMEAGDFAAAAKAQRRMSKAESRIERLEEIKANVERRREEPREAPQYQQPTDPVEAYVQGRTERTAGWIREHRDFVVDPRKNAKLTAAHFDAVGEGLTPDTDAYFAHVETRLGLRSESNGQEPPKPRRQAPVAPVTSTSQGGVSGMQVSLSKGEQAAATDGTLTWTKYDHQRGLIKDPKLIGEPIGLKEYARRKLELTKAGAYDKDRIYSE